MRRFWRLVLVIFTVIVIAQPGLPLALANSLTKDLVYEASTLRNKDHGLFTVLSYNFTKTMEGNPYLLPSSVIESDNPEIIRLANELIEGKTTDQEKSAAIYGWVTENLEYDTETYIDFLNGKQFEFKSALEALHAKKAMCMGYSHLNAALHRAVGIEAKVVYGEDHAWNEIKMDGAWVEQDTTRGSGYINSRTHQFIHLPNKVYFSHSDILKEGEYLW